MARIRSIHPGISTDESYLEMSMAARVAWPLLWCHCDDNGIFEWKPKKLKASIFPGDSIEFADILTEFVGLNCVMKFTVAGKDYGAVRNFRKYQRPQKPKGIYPTTVAVLEYVHLKPISNEKLHSIDTASVSSQYDNDTVSVQYEYDTDTVFSIQREEGRGKREEIVEVGYSSAGEQIPNPIQVLEKIEPKPPAEFKTKQSWDQLRDLLCEEAGKFGGQNWHTARARGRLEVIGPIAALIEKGADLDLDVLPVIRRDAPRCNSPNWAFFVPAIAQARDSRAKAATIVSSENHHGFTRQNFTKPSSLDESFSIFDAAIDQRFGGNGDKFSQGYGQENLERVS